MSLGERIKKRRLELNMSTNDLVKEVGITQSYVSEIENNKKVPTVEVLQKIAKALVVTSSDLLGESLMFLSHRLAEIRGNRSYQEYADYLSEFSSTSITALQLELFEKNGFEKGENDDKANLELPSKSIISKICDAEGKPLSYFYQGSLLFGEDVFLSKGLKFMSKEIRDWVLNPDNYKYLKFIYKNVKDGMRLE